MLASPPDVLKTSQEYSGKTKILYGTDRKDVYLMKFKDALPVVCEEEQISVRKKGFYCSHMSSAVFEHLQKCGCSTHFLGSLGERYHLVHRLDMLPLVVVIRNIASGRFALRWQMKEGEGLKRPVMEFFYKSDELDNPWLNRYHIRSFSICSEQELVRLEEDAWRIHSALSNFFTERGLRFVDVKLEFGLDGEGNLMLADEISSDTCRLWDQETDQRMDREIYYDNSEDLQEAYREVYRRVAWEE